MEAKLVALSTMVDNCLLWINQIFKELQQMEYGPIQVWKDNRAVIHVIEDPLPRTNARSKHIDVRYKYSKELVENKFVKLGYLSSRDNISDLMTKAVTKETFLRLRIMLNLKF